MTRKTTQAFLGLHFAWLFLACQLLSVTHVMGKEAKHETKFVTQGELPVFAGPHNKYYQTGSLKRGTSVDVYLETQDGWCGIRPPEGSYDWVNAEHAYLLPGGKRAEIVGEATQAWIGTSIKVPQAHQWQIQLQPTQVVDVIGEATQAIGSEKSSYGTRSLLLQASSDGFARKACLPRHRLPL